MDKSDIIREAEHDAKIRELWVEFGDIPMNPVTERLEQQFLDFPPGTPREDIWYWFDEQYSRGVYELLYDTGSQELGCPDTHPDVQGRLCSLWCIPGGGCQVYCNQTFRYWMKWEPEVRQLHEAYLKDMKEAESED